MTQEGLRIYVKRTAPDANPLFMLYPLIGRRGFLLTLWRHRVEVRWS